MEKRMIIAVALSMGLLIVWPLLFGPNKTPKVNENVVSTTQAVEENNETASINQTIPTPNNLDDKTAIGEEKFYTLKNDFLLLKFSSIGASLKQITIFNNDIKTAKAVDFFSSKDENPFYIDFIKNVNFSNVLVLEDKIVFTYEKDLKTFSITYTFSKEHPYLINVTSTSSFENKTSLNIALHQNLNIKDNTYGLPLDAADRIREYIYISKEETLREKLKDFKGSIYKLSEKTEWFAVGDKYFSLAVLNDKNLDISISKIEEGYFNFNFLTPEGDLNFSFYAGPKDVDYLRPINKTLTQVMDYGWLSFISVPMLELMKFLYSLIPNYGVAIILLTLIVRLLLYPLQHKSMKSMKRLQVLQPQIKAIQEKYKSDKEKLNKEVMQFMKTHKVNPMGGCFPMLLQLPVFFALYKVLGNAVELYQAPFVFWIHDLALKDPVYVLPLLMGVMMFFQQKLTPNPSMDPMQAKIMLYMMPIMFTFFMINLPSGLTLYIMFSSALGIGQQYFINKSA